MRRQKKVYREIAPAIDCIFLCSLESFITKTEKSYKQDNTQQ